MLEFFSLLRDASDIHSFPTSSKGPLPAGKGGNVLILSDASRNKAIISLLQFLSHSIFNSVFQHQT